jgi:general secretion pathway protein D
VLGFNARAATLVAATAQPSYSVGDSVAVSVSVPDAANLYAFQFDLSFDPTVLSAQSVNEGGYFLSNGISFYPGTIDNTGGTISSIADSLAGNVPGFSGSTLLVTAVFTALKPAPSTSVSPLNIILLDDNLSPIATTATPATFDVSSATVAPEPGSLGLVIASSGAWLLILTKRCK